MMLLACAVRDSACTPLRLPCLIEHDESKYGTCWQESQCLNKALQGSVMPSDRKTQA